MKNISKLGLTTAFMMGLAGFTPVMAAEQTEMNTTLAGPIEYYQSALNCENSFSEIVEQAFNQDIEQFELIETENGLQYVSDNTVIDVKGIDLNTQGFQIVKMAMTNKKDNLSPLLPASAQPLVSAQEIVQIKNALVEIVDEEAPILTVQDSITTQQNQTVDIEGLIEASDNSGTVNVEVNGEVDYTVAGEYGLEIVASDESGNTSTQTMKVVVEKDDFYDRIAEAAKAQVGVSQDCTMLVTNALKAVGIDFHGWPEEYLSLGDVTNDPVPGDICVYNGHVALYIGNGQAVHGGWLGNQTVISTVECTNQFIAYVHVRKP